MKTLLHVGATKKTIRAARESIKLILEAKADQETIRTALSVFCEVTKCNNITISNNTFGSIK